MATQVHRSLGARLVETVRRYWDLGLTSYGGPGVHVVILRRRFVDQLKWLDSTTFADLFTLGNALPGPGSTQLAFSIAVSRNGTLAGLLAFFTWAVPASAGMAGLAAGVRSFPPTLPPIVYGLLTGLNAAAVGLIALAAYQLSTSSVTDGITRLIVLGSASFGVCYHAPWMYPSLVAAGGLLTLAFDYRLQVLTLMKRGMTPRKHSTCPPPPTSELPIGSSTLEDIELADQTQLNSTNLESKDDHVSIRSDVAITHDLTTNDDQTIRHRNTPPTPEFTPPPTSALETVTEVTHIMVPSTTVAIIVGSALIAGVISLLVTRSQLHNPPRSLDFFCNMIIAGLIIFGGGPVVIPLLKGYTVDNGWVRPRDFLLGFAILQAFPGPNFAFACFLGVLAVPTNPGLGAILGFIGIFTPGIALKLSLLPLYNKWRRHQPARSVLRGLNAAASGLIYTAVWQLFLVGYIYKPVDDSMTSMTTGSSTSGSLTSDPFWGVVAACAFVASHSFKVPPALSVLGGAVAGLAWFGVVGVSGTERRVGVAMG